MTHTYPRESVEFQAVTVEVDGQTVTAGVEFTLTFLDARPTDWTSAVNLGGKIGVMVGGLAVGIWHVYARSPTTPRPPSSTAGG